MQKIGLFGGTFNPIHEGHLRLAAAFYKELGLDKLYFIPDHTPPHKDASLLASGLDRYNMCRVATVDMQGTEVCDYEIRRDTKSYTVHTVRYFKDAYPDAELYLLMGGDMFLTVQHWVEAQTIFALAAVCGGARNVGEYQALVDHAQILTQNGARPLVVDIEPYIASSTVIRAGMGTGADFAHDALPVSVGRYIDTVRPYGGEQEEIVRYRQALSERLSAKRHEHSVCVAKEAVVLAILFGADEKKAYTAGLLHDIAKDLTHDEQLQMLKKFGIILDDTERGAPKLWHAIIGAHYIGTLGINDAEIINAIRYHTTAREGISLLEQIIYIADCISFDRDYDDAHAIRERIRSSLDSAMLCALALTIKGLVKKESPIHTDTVKAYNSFLPAAE